MQVLKEKKVKKVVFFGTGGTISGLSSESSDVLNYKPGLIGVSDLAQNAMSNASVQEEFEPVFEQIAQIDSKDMQFSIWAKLLERLLYWSKDEEVVGFLITHGTDTVEETAFFLHLATMNLKYFPTIALTCAMRPASAVDADGPQNLRDTTALLLKPEWAQSGVVVVCAGTVHHAKNVQKIYSDRLDAFSSLPSEPIGRFVQGILTKTSHEHGQEESDEPSIQLPSLNDLLLPKSWPWVEIVHNYTQSTGACVNALLAYKQPSGATLSGLVVAGTGIGTVSEELSAALQTAKQIGVLVWQSSKCAFAQAKPKRDASFYDFHGLTPVKARIALIMHLLANNL